MDTFVVSGNPSGEWIVVGSKHSQSNAWRLTSFVVVDQTGGHSVNSVQGGKLPHSYGEDPIMLSWYASELYHLCRSHVQI